MSRFWQKQWLLSAALLLLGLGLAYGLLVGKPGPTPEPAPEPVPPIVDVVRAQPSQRAIAVTTQGSVQPLRQVSVVSRVAGRVVSVADSFAEGGFFAEGEDLVVVEDADYRFAITRAESQVAAAEQRVAEEKGRALQARREWRDLGSEQANALFLRKPQLASAEAALAAAKADLEAARLDLQRTRISLPFDGRVSRKLVDAGQYVTPGTPVAEVYSTEAVQVRLPLTDRQVALLDLPLTYQGEATPAAPVPVTLQARFGNRDWQWSGQILRTDASIDVDSRMVYAVAEVRDPFTRPPGSERPPLAPGLFVQATIEGRQIDGVTLLPRSALRSDESVMLVDREGRTAGREVEVLQGDARQVWVQGLEAGERVVLGQPVVTTAGMQVTVREVQSVAGSEY